MDDARGGGIAETARTAGDAAVSASPRDAAAPAFLGHRARLRRRLVEGGPAALLDHELLEVVLFLALPRRDTKPIALALARRFGGFAGAVAAPPAALAAVPGLGEAGAAALKAVEAAALRLSAPGAAERPVLGDRDRLGRYLSAAPARDGPARPRVLFLDEQDRLLADEAQAQAQGRGPAGRASPVAPRELVRRALEVGAAALVLVHDRPPPGDGGPSPSRADAAVAAEVEAAAGPFGIAVREHPAAAARAPRRGGSPWRRGAP